MARTILVIDDNAMVREVVQSMLEFRGYDVFPVEDGPKAIAHCLDHRVDVALVDVDMPRMDGVEVCRVLRRQAEALGRRLLIWLMTGVTRPELVVRAKAAGAAGVLSKPFTSEELLARIENGFGELPAPGSAA